MPNPEVIRAQTTPEDGALFDTSLARSKWIHFPHETFTDDVRQKLVLEIGQKNSGQQIIVPFEKQSTFLEDTDLILTPQALVVPGDGTFIRYVDWLGIAAVKQFEWRYGSNTLATYRPEVVFSEIQYLKDEKKANETLLLLGDLSAAERNTYAANPKPLRVKIPSPWRGLRGHSPLICGLANKLTLEIRLAEAREIIQSDGTRPSTIAFSDIHLDQQSIHTTGSIRSQFVGLTLDPRGVSYLIKDYEVFDYIVPANTLNANSDHTIELRDFDGPISKMSVIVRTTAQLDPTSGTTIDPYAINTNFLDGLHYAIRSNSMDIQDPEVMNNDGVFKINKFFKCRHSTRQGTFLWAEFPCAKNVASGSVSFGNFTNPRLVLRNAELAGVHPELQITIIGDRWNWNVHQRGNLQKVWR